ncbi:MAG: DUF3857 domain-containing protein [Novosphingobium sp.]|nr:DUF3857 domain-containing protein [Novosphingobium sp.]MBO9601013.1 DUF3857 domain-containing protein [Novosphingobium sp.]
MAPLSAKNDQVGFGPVPDWTRINDPLPAPEDPKGAIFFRYQDYEVHLDKNGQSNFIAYRVALLHPNALQLGNLALTWNPAAGAPVVHRLKVYRDGTERDVLATAKFTILRREDKLEQASLDGLLTATLQVPDLRVGDELEIAYTLPGSDPTLGTDNFGVLLLAGAASPGRFRMRLSWADGQEPHTKLTPDMESLATRDANSVSINVDMPPPLSPPKDAPPRYSWQRTVEFSDFADWPAVSRRLAPLFATASTLAKDSPVKEEAARIAAAHPDASGRAAAALKLVEQQVRYIYVGLDGGNFTPASADATWQRRYGDCKGKTALLLALLRELGISAEPVLANNSGTDDGMDSRLPNPGEFDHVLVRAMIDGKDYWLDGTMPPVVPAEADPVLPYRWVLPLTADGKDIEHLPWKPASVPDSLEAYEIDARGGLDEPAKITQTVVERGIKGIVDYYQFSSATDDQLETAFRQKLEGSSEWNTIDKVSWRFDVPTQASVLEISGTGPINWDSKSDTARSLALPGGGFNPPQRRQRAADQDQTAPFYDAPDFDCRVTTVRLPAGANLSDWWYNSSFNNLIYGSTHRRSFEFRDGALRMIRASRTLAPEIDPASAAKDNARLAQFDNSMAWLEYDPGADRSLDTNQSVRATYEGDWVADESPCLDPVMK